MDKIIISPSKYVQGANALDNIGQYVKPLGLKALAIADDFVTGLVGEQVTQSFADAEGGVVLEKFNGECCRPEIERLIALILIGDIQNSEKPSCRQDVGFAFLNTLHRLTVTNL